MALAAKPLRPDRSPGAIAERRKNFDDAMHSNLLEGGSGRPLSDTEPLHEAWIAGDLNDDEYSAAIDAAIIARHK